LIGDAPAINSGGSLILLNKDSNTDELSLRTLGMRMPTVIEIRRRCDYAIIRHSPKLQAFCLLAKMIRAQRFCTCLTSVAAMRKQRAVPETATKDD
jgi:hypothetical protein